MEGCSLCGLSLPSSGVSVLGTWAKRWLSSSRHGVCGLHETQMEDISITHVHVPLKPTTGAIVLASSLTKYLPRCPPPRSTNHGG